jgi:hypothetical protein
MVWPSLEHGFARNPAQGAFPMSARDLTADQLAAFERFISGPAGGSPAKARARQVTTVARMLIYVDKLIAEAAEARIAAPGLLEMRDWLTFNLDTHAAALAPALDIRPDPLKDAKAAAVVAARRGDSAGYKAAREAERAAA